MVNTTSQQRLLLPVPEAAAQLGVGRTLVWRLVQTGDRRSVRIGKRRLVPRAELEAYVQRLQREGAR
jgi:excisionase family DNA binding protein